MKPKSILFLLILTIVIGGCNDSVLYDQDLYNSIAPQSIDSKFAIISNPDSLTMDYYWFENKKVPIQKLDGKYLIMYDSIENHNIHKFLESNAVSVKNINKLFNNHTTLAEVTNSNITPNSNLKIATIQGEPLKISTILSNVSYWTPYYKMKNGNEIGIGNYFYVELKSNKDLLILKELADKYSVELIGEDKYLKNLYNLRCTNKSKGNALQLANIFHECGLFSFSCPELLGAGNLTCINEPLFTSGLLWHLGNNQEVSYININYGRFYKFKFSLASS